ncbi:type III-B CRISPR module RAMP protein Cmr1 [Lihuaxuella thermophila]|uniref:CRISPR type III-B/RAMP module RAMP protein Cmr1 n=1 Tax=Lihuaxuella thermophila TaxID=1173111 RepID=A0A1H8IL27_9BACL|nr:type III-B CRISPR module RAMP protein Cmr1 [Lihuaxuella thermophila]SEN69029.1 CRISPR type III-B/RAMP module RAMP protein Cmr1 [Lihuaxuella thermophila]
MERLVERLTVTYRIVTPMFMSGADPQQAELRLPSIKGALRYWYRAVDGRYNQNADNGKGCTWEEKIFGGSGSSAGQAAFLMKEDVRNLRHSHFSKRNRWFIGLNYITYSIKENRPYWLPGNKFSIQFLMRPVRNKEAVSFWKALISSVWLLGQIGSLGTRSRRGFGTVALEEWQYDGENTMVQDLLRQLPIADQAKSPEEWKSKFVQGLDKILDWPEKHSEVTHPLVSGASFYLAENGYTCWNDALASGVSCLRSFRQNHKRDRLALGLPMIIPARQKEGPTVTIRPKRFNRIASPVWLRVITIGDQYYPFFSILTVPPFPDLVREEKIGNQKKKPERLNPPTGNALDAFAEYLIGEGFQEVT